MIFFIFCQKACKISKAVWTFNTRLILQPDLQLVTGGTIAQLFWCSSSIWCFLRMCGDTVMDAKNSEVRKQRGRFLASSDSTCQMPKADRRSSQIFTYSSMCNFRIYSRTSLTYDPDPSIQSWLCRIQSNIIATAFPAHLYLFVTLVFPGHQFFPHHNHFQWHYHRGIHTRGDYIS